MEEKMKLLMDIACHWALSGGNVKTVTVMGDTWMDRLSDAGSIPASSTPEPLHSGSFFAGNLELGNERAFDLTNLFW